MSPTERIRLDDRNAWEVPEHLRRYTFAGRFVRGSLVLDIACGTGYGTALMAEHGARLALGGDISCEATSLAASQFSRSDVHFVTLDAQRLPFATGKFDTVISLETVEHLRAPRQFLLECCRVLRPGGWLVVSTPNRLFKLPWNRDRNPHHVREWNLQGFLGLFQGLPLVTQPYCQAPGFARRAEGQLLATFLRKPDVRISQIASRVRAMLAKTRPTPARRGQPVAVAEADYREGGKRYEVVRLSTKHRSGLARIFSEPKTLVVVARKSQQNAGS